ncbi:MAG: type II toxin-antitoxin system death-on-curing family toxin [Candidatus Omnitrophica bacterium]|nr:type II toxin-antitoxin system death-on-curing family toxin [Candidatus Omnitrophota bacterium]
MNYLNINQVLAIHNEMIEQIGGSKGIRDIGLLESAVARPQATFGGEDLYPDIFSKTAALGHSLVCNHSFVDGNKRTGYMAMRLFLNINRYEIKASVEEKYKFVIEITKKIRKEKSIAEWLKEHSQKIK